MRLWTYYIVVNDQCKNDKLMIKIQNYSQHRLSLEKYKLLLTTVFQFSAM